MTWFRVGGAGIPAALKNAMNAVFNKKFGTSGQNYPPKQWPDEVNLLGPLPEGTETGSIAHITDGADDVPLKKCEITLPASLDGYSSVDVVQCGKNLIDDSTAYQFGSNYITIGGYLQYNFSYFLKAGTYTISLAGVTAYAYIRKEGTTTNTIIKGKDASSGTFTLDSDGFYALWLYSNTDNISVSDIEYIQLEVGSTATTYEPYTAPTTHTASLGRTIYGGTADLVNGEGTETHATVDMGTLTWQYDSANTRFFTVGLTGVIKRGTSGWITDLAVDSPYSVASGTANDKTVSEYASTGYVYIKDTDYTDPTTFKAFLSGKYLTYPLATPIDFTFDGITPTPETALGVNNFWADEGDTTVVYRRDIDLALQAVSSSRGLMMASRPVTQLIGEQADPDQVNELNEEAENTEEQEGEDDAR